MILVLLLSGFCSSLCLFRLLLPEPYLRGADAYYYALQANYWAKTGDVKIPDSSPVHKMTGLLQKSGFATATSVRLYEASSLFLFFLSCLGLTIFFWEKIDFASSLLLLYLGLSPSLLFTALEFPKFFTLLILLPFWFYPLLLSPARGGLALVIALGSCIFHRAALPLALCFAAALGFLQIGKGLGGNRSRWLCLVGLLTAVAVFYFFGMHDRFHLLDLGRVTWKNPQIGIVSLLRRQNLPTAIKGESLFLGFFFFLSGIRFWRRNPEQRLRLLLPFSLLLPACFPLGAEEVFGVGERYAILLPALFVLGILYLRSLDPVEEAWNLSKKILFFALAILIPLSAKWRLELSHPRSIDPDFSSYDQVTDELKTQSIPMLIAHKGVVFFYKFKLMREAFPYEPESHWDKSRVWRLLYKIAPEELNYYLPETCGLESGLWKTLSTEDYNLIREDCWEAMRAKLHREEDSDLYQRAWETWLNPAQKRPAFLYPKHEGDKDLEFSALPPK